MNPTLGNPKNDRVKRAYLIELKQAYGRSDATVEQVRYAIDRLELHTGFKDFASFDKEQAIAFKRALLASKAKRSGKPISIATAHHALQALKDFLIWLRARPGYSRRIAAADIAYLSLSANDERAAHASQPKTYATIEEYRAALFAMPSETETDRRDRALFAMIMLTGMRDSAVVSLKLKHVSIERSRIFQDPKEVRTKFRKPIETYFLASVGSDVIAIVQEWVRYLTTEKQFGPDDPLFPKTAVGANLHGSFAVEGLSREHWANAAPVRQIFARAFAGAGLRYVKPHTIRDTLTQLAYALRLDGEQLKAWSQNIGHDHLATTLLSYGTVSPERQAEIMGGLGKPRKHARTDNLAADLAEWFAARDEQFEQRPIGQG